MVAAGGRREKRLENTGRGLVLILLQERLGLCRATCATKLRDWLKTGRSGENFQEMLAHSD